MNTNVHEVVVGDLSRHEHAEAVLFLLDEYARDIMGGGNELTGYAREHLIPELKKLPHCHILLAFAGVQPAGLAICFKVFSTFACRPILNIHDFNGKLSFNSEENLVVNRLRKGNYFTYKIDTVFPFSKMRPPAPSNFLLRQQLSVLRRPHPLEPLFHHFP